MSSEPGTETVTAEALRERAARKRQTAATTTGRTSTEPGARIRSIERTCDAGHSYTADVLPGGTEIPPRCMICHPLRQAEAIAAGMAAPRGLHGRELLDAMHQAGVNVHKYQDATMDAFDPTHDPEALGAAQAWLAEWEATRRDPYPRRPWAYFYGAGSGHYDNGRVKLGQLGNGKTMLQVAMARQLLEAGSLSPKRFRFVTMEALLLEAEATFRAQADDSELKMLRRYERPDLLIVDEVGVREQPSSHAIRILDELTKRREGKATLWTANLSVSTLMKLGEGMKRIGSRIGGECGDGACYAVQFFGPDRRRARSLMGRERSVA